MAEHKASADEMELFDRAEVEAGRQGDAGDAPAGTEGHGNDRDRALDLANERADRLEAEMAELKELVEKMSAARPGRRETGGRDLSLTRAARVKRDAAEALSEAVHPGSAASSMQGDAPVSRGGQSVRSGSSSGDSEARREARARLDAGDDASSSKEPPSPSSAAGEPGVGGGVEELRKDSMMAHLLDSLEDGQDIGHYGRLVFVMIARHFLPHDELLQWLMKDEDLGEQEGRQMLLQVEQRDYSPPRRDRILQWQSEQEFPILPDVDDPDSGNVYRTLNFPKEIYQHIGHYREQKADSGS